MENTDRLFFLQRSANDILVFFRVFVCFVVAKFLSVIIAASKAVQRFAAPVARNRSDAQEDLAAADGSRGKHFRAKLVLDGQLESLGRGSVDPRRAKLVR